jgi:tetratricopeptide (TPR) repeat protein
MASFDDGVFYLKRANTNRLEKECQKALDLYSQAIKNLRYYRGDSIYLPNAYLGRAFCYRENGEHENAILDCDSALKINPDNAWGWAMRGASHYEVGNTSKAIDDLTIAIELDPNSEWALYNRGYIHSLQWNFISAEKDLRKALEINPKNDWTIHNLEFISQFRSDYKDELEHFKSTFVVRKDYPNTLGEIDEMTSGNDLPRISSEIDTTASSKYRTHILNNLDYSPIPLDDIGVLNIENTLSGHIGKVICIDIAKDGKLAISGDDQGEIILWDLVDKKKIYSLANFNHPIYALRISQNNRYGIASSLEKVCIWDIRKSKPKKYSKIFWIRNIDQIHGRLWISQRIHRWFVG